MKKHTDVDIVNGVCGAEEQTCKRLVHSDSIAVTVQPGKTSEATSVFLQFSGVGREMELDFGEARQFFGNDYLPIISVVPWNRTEKSYYIMSCPSGCLRSQKRIQRSTHSRDGNYFLQHSIQIVQLTKNLVPVGSGTL